MHWDVPRGLRGDLLVGAVVGGLIDHLLTKRVTVYTAGTSSRPSKSVTIGPFVRRDRNGVQVVMKF